MSAFTYLWILFAALPGLVLPDIAHAEERNSSAVILMYHRFGEEAHPGTSIKMDQFDAHIQELILGDYHVLPLKEIMARLKVGDVLPDRTVAITIDDAFLSVYEKAWPLLRQHDLPFTIFVATDPVDRGLSGYMSWDHITELQKNGVDIGSQAITHTHMPTLKAV